MAAKKHQAMTTGMRLGRAHVHATVASSPQRDRHDFHITPERGTRGLLSVEPIYRNYRIWEPACGKGHISEVLKRTGYSVFSSDLIDRGYGVGDYDFLARRPRHDFDVILTNPPFKKMYEFIERALSFPQARKVIMLGRTLWLEGKDKRKFFVETRLSRVWIHSERINVRRHSYRKARADGRGGMVSYSWYVWDRTGHGSPVVEGARGRFVVPLGFIPGGE